MMVDDIVYYAAFVLPIILILLPELLVDYLAMT